MKLFAKAFALVFIFSSTSVVSASEDKAFSISGWKEVLVSVRDISAYDEFFLEVAQWQLKSEGQISRDQLDAWQLPKEASARYATFYNPGNDSGFIKLLQFSGVEQMPMRMDSQSWDTGGIFDINVRVRDLEKMAVRMRALGWQARAPVTSFTFGPFEVKEWIVHSPDGLAIAMVERIAPELTGWPHLKSISRTFNATQVIADMDKGLSFYEGVLGFQRYLEHEGVSKEEAPNVLGLPQNLTTRIPREVYILHPEGKNEGSIEILKFKGATGSDYSSMADLPNLGIAAMRFPVQGLEALAKHFQEAGVDMVHPLLHLGDYSAITIRSPEGAWLEFYE